MSLLAASACGGGGQSDSTRLRAERAIQADAQRRAQSTSLRLSDFPAGWRSLPSTRDRAAEDRLRNCLGIDYSALTIVGEARSERFASRHTEASSDATVFADDGQARNAGEKLAKGMSSGKAKACFGDQIEAENAVQVDEVDLGELSVKAPRGIEQALAWQIAVSYTVPSSEGPSTTAYLELVTLRRGDTLARITSTDVVGPFDPELRARLVQALAERLRRE